MSTTVTIPRDVLSGLVILAEGYGMAGMEEYRDLAGLPPDESSHFDRYVTFADRCLRVAQAALREG
jgi:hypothetical protein